MRLRHLFDVLVQCVDDAISIVRRDHEGIGIGCLVARIPRVCAGSGPSWSITPPQRTPFRVLPLITTVTTGTRRRRPRLPIIIIIMPKQSRCRINFTRTAGVSFWGPQWQKKQGHPLPHDQPPPPSQYELSSRCLF